MICGSTLLQATSRIWVLGLLASQPVPVVPFPTLGLRGVMCPLQVYKGRLKTGEVVAVKVQRPHVLETVTIDLFVVR